MPLPSPPVDQASLGTGGRAFPPDHTDAFSEAEAE